MDGALLVYATFPDAGEGLAIAEDRLRAGIIACTNVIPGVCSVCVWKGEVGRGEDAVGVLKTRLGLTEAVHAALKERRPCETPIILFIEPAGGDEATLMGLDGETAGPTR